MGLRALGDSAWLFEAGGNDARGRLALVLRVLRILERNVIPEVLDVVSSFDTVAVHFDPSDGEVVLDWLTSLSPPDGDEGISMGGRVVEVPVVYGGDLGELSRDLGRTEAEIVGLHSGADYTVAAIGFSPGFPYLLGLPEELRLPRRATPRPVAAGSVAVAGGQAGIYPFDSQGGWHVIGHTDLRLFDPAGTPPSHLRPGDQVRFVPVDRLERPREGKTGAPATVHGGIEVIAPGALTTVQDAGRPGFQSFGVSPGGAADGVAARVANRLVGNADEAAVLECCMSGPVLRFHEAARLAWVGWADAQSGRPVEIQAGGEIDLRGRMRALRGYLAVSGGIDTPPVLGSRATDLRAGIGGFHGRALRSSDRLAIGPATNGPMPGDWRVGWPVAGDGVIELRFVKGVQIAWFSEDSLKTFRKSVYQLSPVSDRMGARLDGPALALVAPREMVSQPVVAGSVQVPPDGRPIVLMAERQTLGGYPQIGHVISADLPKLARAWPGTPLRFREVTLEEARQAWRDLRRELGLLQAGIGFLPGSRTAHIDP